jgi:hypothetical protein
MRALRAALLAGLSMLPSTLPTRPAEATVVAAEDSWRVCRAAAAVEERRSGIPQGLLWAIALAETGRWNAQARAKSAWPWTLNVEGEGRYLSSKAEAVNTVRDLLNAGRRSIDVGCMQINLRHHPDAFADLEEAFDPRANVAYAARYLRSLFEERGSWPAAAGRYHSATPEFFERYRDRVMQIWAAEARTVPAEAVTHVEIEAASVEPAARSAPATASGRPQFRIIPLDPARTERIVMAWRGRAPAEPAAGPRPTGAVTRDARAEAAFAERRADLLQQWRQSLVRKGHEPGAAIRP